jgi:hypothetical protein
MWDVKLHSPENPDVLLKKWENVWKIGDILDEMNEVLEEHGSKERLTLAHLRQVASPGAQAVRPAGDRRTAWIKLKKSYGRTIELDGVKYHRALKTK